MKYTFYVFITTHLFMVTPWCNAMEKPKKIKQIMTLNHVPNPLKAQYITQDSIAISSNRTCNIVHTDTDTMINIPLKDDSSFAGIQQNSNKIAFSSQNYIKTYSSGKRLSGIMIQNIINIYDTKSGELLHTIMAKDTPQSPIFSPLDDDTVFLGYTKSHDMIQKYNYKENCYTEHPFTDFACFACHPTKKQICIARNSLKPVIYTMDDFNPIKKMPLSDLVAHTNLYSLCEYSPNGSFIAIGNNMFLYIWNLRTEKASMLPAVDSETIQKIAFHQNNIILALLSINHHNHSIIRYWDLITRKPIKEMRPLNSIGRDLSFSPDGKNILVTLENKCVIYSVPPEVINPEEVS